MALGDGPPALVLQLYGARSAGHSVMGQDVLIGTGYVEFFGNTVTRLARGEAVSITVSLEHPEGRAPSQVSLQVTMLDTDSGSGGSVATRDGKGAGKTLRVSVLVHGATGLSGGDNTAPAAFVAAKVRIAFPKSLRLFANTRLTLSFIYHRRRFRKRVYRASFYRRDWRAGVRPNRRLFRFRGRDGQRRALLKRGRIRKRASHRRGRAVAVRGLAGPRDVHSVRRRRGGVFADANGEPGGLRPTGFRHAQRRHRQREPHRGVYQVRVVFFANPTQRPFLPPLFDVH